MGWKEVEEVKVDNEDLFFDRKSLVGVFRKGEDYLWDGHSVDYYWDGTYVEMHWIGKHTFWWRITKGNYTVQMREELYFVGNSFAIRPMPIHYINHL